MSESRKFTVNIHFLRSCNYHCKFCFHRGCEDNTTLPIHQWKTVIDNISSSKQIKRINFAGGEPFLNRKLLANLAHYAKAKGVETSVITNGSLVTRKVFEDIHPYLDMIGISVDSGNDSVNFNIGRWSRRSGQDEGSHVEAVKRVANLCKEFKKNLKLNTVICRENLNDSSIFELVNDIQPFRWKVFRVLKIDNENGVTRDEREPYDGFLTDDEWENWKEKCRQQCQVEPVYENNDEMLTSYIVVDESGYILDSSSGSKLQKASLLEVQIDDVLSDIGFDADEFIKRGGNFNLPNIEDIEEVGNLI